MRRTSRVIVGAVAVAPLCLACAIWRANPHTPQRDPIVEDLATAALQYELDLRGPREGKGPYTYYVGLNGQPAPRDLLLRLKVPSGYRMQPLPAIKCVNNHSGCWSVGVSPTADPTCRKVVVVLEGACACPGLVYMDWSHRTSTWCQEDAAWKMRDSHYTIT
jgi:hypothetical protein